LLTSRLDLATLRRSEDSFVDELIAGVVARGHPLVRAHFPRCYVDVNREPYELDPRMFDGRLPSFANTRSMRVAGGLGTVARVVGDAQEIYDQRISVAEALKRIDGLYKPYHRTLRRVFMRLHRDFGAAVLIDCHSMPSATGAKDERPRADFVLGDRYGTSCVPQVAETIEATMREFGYAVSRNKPYAGGFITEHYGNPTAGLHAIQLEINRALYMDERRYQKAASFAKLAKEFEILADRLAAIPLEELRPYRAAAE
jgi:N-formylglutamate deformylase